MLPSERRRLFHFMQETDMYSIYRTVLLAAGMVVCFTAHGAAQQLAHQTENPQAPAVYFTSDISAEGLMKVYTALEQQITGSVGIKVSFGGPDEQYLNPQLLTGLVGATDGVLIDSNGLAGNRWTSAMNYALADVHGFTDAGRVQMLDEDGDIDMPVPSGHLLTTARTGRHFDQYDTLIAVHRFKLHYIEAMGGNIKNISLCLASKSGKNLIHSGGTDPDRYHSTEPDVLARSFADAAKAAVTYKPNWAFINVLDSFEPDDHCAQTENLGNIGIIASLDVVAADQCALDLTLERSSADEQTKQAWQDYHQTDVLKYAEDIGVGSRNYRFISLDE